MLRTIFSRVSARSIRLYSSAGVPIGSAGSPTPPGSATVSTQTTTSDLVGGGLRPLGDLGQSIGSSTLSRARKAIEYKTSDLPYHVRRTQNDFLPVYPKYTGRGETKRVEIVVRRCDGDVEAFARDLEVKLANCGEPRVGGKGRKSSAIPPVRVQPITRHVVVHGYTKRRVMKILEDQGF
ncbi:54S ribosomal protein img2, mitochondrial [Savitreella phatthalungensis]